MRKLEKTHFRRIVIKMKQKLMLHLRDQNRIKGELRMTQGKLHLQQCNVLKTWV